MKQGLRTTFVEGFDTSRTGNTTLKSLRDRLIYSGTEATHVYCPGAVQTLGSDRVLVLSTSYMTAQTVPQHAQGGGGVVPGGEAFPHPLVFFGGGAKSTTLNKQTTLIFSKVRHCISSLILQ